MANEKVKNEKVLETKNEKVLETTELNMEEKVTVRSIAPWSTGFSRMDHMGDVMIPPNGTTRVQRGELISQVQNGNKLLVGTDFKGSHATLYIEDAATRIECDFEDVDKNRAQKVLTPESVRKLFDSKTIKTFTEKLEDMVVTRAEKCAIIEIIKKEKINDFEKIRIVEDYTGFRL